GLPSVAVADTAPSWARTTCWVWIPAPVAPGSTYWSTTTTWPAAGEAPASAGFASVAATASTAIATPASRHRRARADLRPRRTDEVKAGSSQDIRPPDRGAPAPHDVAR